MAVAFPLEPERNPNAEMLEIIRNAIPHEGVWAPAAVAEAIVSDLQINDPDLLDLWLTSNSTRFVQRELVQILSARRAKARTQTDVRKFADAAARYAAGDLDALSVYELTYDIGDGSQMCVADMTGREHSFIADKFSLEAKTQMMLSEFHRAVAKKIGNRKTSEVFSQEQYEKLYRSIVSL